MDICEVMQEAVRRQCVIVDCETNGTPIHDDDWQLYGIGLAAGGRVCYSTAPHILQTICELLWQFPHLVVAHNAVFDLRCLKKFSGLRDYPKYPICTMIAMNLLDDNLTPKQLGLKTIIAKLFQHKMMTWNEASLFGPESQVFADYCAKGDCFQTERLWDWQRPQLKERGLMPCFERILMPMVKVVADMENVGVQWDVKHNAVLKLIYGAVAANYEDQLKDVLGRDVSLSSPDQIAKRLFVDMRIPTDGVKKTKGGKNKQGRYQVDADTMGRLAKKGHAVCQVYTRHNHLSHMISTYIDAPMRFMDKCNRVHPTTWLVSATGRTRQSNPSLQTIPAMEDDAEIAAALELEAAKQLRDCGAECDDIRLRSTFVARPRYKLIVHDWSQQQLRIAAHVTGDVRLINAYTTWQCTCGAKGHSAKLLEVCPKCGALPNEAILKDKDARGFWHGLDLHQQTLDLIRGLRNRKDAKICNFQLIFLATAKTMHDNNPQYSIDEWESNIADFFTGYDGVKQYHWKMRRVLQSKGECRDMFGRIRRVSKDGLKEEFRFKHAWNQFVNFPIQAPEVAIAELAAAKIREEMLETGMWAESIGERGVTQVHLNHDELVHEAPEEMVPEAERIIQKHMRYCVQLKVPMNVDGHIVDRWSQAKG